MLPDRIKERLARNSQEVAWALYCDPKVENQEEHDRLWQSLLSSPLIGEIQYEAKYSQGYWKAIASMIKSPITSIHCPTQERDLAGPDAQHRAWSIEETLRSFDLAEAIGAEYSVLHLTPQNDFQDRDSQLERAMDSLRQIIDYHKNNKYTAVLLLENLEWPKWPANLQETVDLARRVKAFYPNLGMCIDVPHLWHNLVSLMPGADPAIDFPLFLRDYLENVSLIVPIKMFHLAGAYIRKGTGGDVHATHAIPETKPVDFNGIWMEMDPVLKIIRECAKSSKPPAVILEIHDIDLANQEKACLWVKDYLNQK